MEERECGALVAERICDSVSESERAGEAKLILVCVWKSCLPMHN